MKRFFVPRLDAVAANSLVSLSAEEAHHFRDVLRGCSGERIEVFDGDGGSRLAEVRSLSRREVVVQMIDELRRQAASRPMLRMAVAAPKAERLRWLVEKCVELDVDELIPLVTERAVVKPGGGKLERMEEAAIQACKQCGRNRLLRIQPLTNWSALWSAKNGPAQPDDELLMIADQHGVPLLNQLQGTTPDRPRAILVVIGPEGGLSPTEVAEARTRGAVGVSAGRHILRVETAAAALAATIRCYYAAGESAAPMSPAGLSAATPSSDGGSGSC